MKTLMIAGLSAVLLTAGATAASAQTTGDAARTGTYGSIGISSEHSKRTDTDLSGLNLRLGQRFNDNWGVEGEAAFGTNKDGNGLGDYRLKDKVGVYGVGFLPVGDFDLLARAGLANTDLKRPAGADKSETGTSFDYGVGAQYHMAPGYAIRADITQSEYSNHRGSGSTASLNLVKKF